MRVFRPKTKPVEWSIRDADEPGHRLRRELSALDLTVFGIGVIVGTGIFVLTGEVAREKAGPAVALSFITAAVACALAALCYAEFASTVPVAGSAYTFAYATLGELPAWIIGWDLVLELALAAATVAAGWSGYAASLLATLGWRPPPSLAGEKAVFNVPAALVVLAVTAVLVLGVKISSRVNAVIVAIKIAVVLFVIAAGLFFVRAANYQPFVPRPVPTSAAHGATTPLIQVLFGYTPSTYGWAGIFAGAAIVFFAFIGFDIVATAAEETRHPQRDLPIGIIGSLAICTSLYVAVSLVVVGMQPYRRLSVDAPLADAFRAAGRPGFAGIVSIGALAGLTTVVLILMLGQSRVFFAMSRDGLLPSWLAAVHPRYGTPYRLTITIGFAVAAVAGLVPLAALADLVNIGTLFAFVVVSAGVVILRNTRPDLPRSFRVPAAPLVPALAVLACAYLMLNLPVETWLRFVAWMLAGIVIYFLFGRRNSRLAAPDSENSVTWATPPRFRGRPGAQ